MAYRLPSVKMLITKHLADNKADAGAIREALSVGDLSKANRVMGTFGVEATCIPENAYSNCQKPRHEIEFFNVGDPYVVTVLRIDGGNWLFIGCWGDTLAWLERC